jgi:YidC/Oxa1 family membrane protein insertase
MSSLFGAVVGAAHSAISALATLLFPIADGLAAALAIIVFTLLIRLLISPLSYLQVRGERRRAALAPQLEKIREKHRDDQLAIATESLALQRANGSGPFIGLLPGLAQAPFFMIMYRVALDAPAGALFGVPLTAHLFAGLPVFALLLALAGLLAWWSSRRFTVTTGQLALLRYLPYLSVLAVAWMPLAGGLYLVTSTAWTALEHLVWRRPASPRVTTGNR